MVQKLGRLLCLGKREDTTYPDMSLPIVDKKVCPYEKCMFLGKVCQICLPTSKQNSDIT